MRFRTVGVTNGRRAIGGVRPLSDGEALQQDVLRTSIPSDGGICVIGSRERW
jgi:hypothetical protein